MTTMCVGIGMGATVIWENPAAEIAASAAGTAEDATALAEAAA
jgi:hypothetical protein